MPLLAGGRCIPDPGYRCPFAFLEFPENQIVLQAIRAKRQVVAIWLQIEQYAGSLTDASGQALEPHGDLTASEIFHVLGGGVRIVAVSLNPFEKLGVALAVQRSPLARDPGGGLPFLPKPPIDSLNTFPASPHYQPAPAYCPRHLS